MIYCANNNLKKLYDILALKKETNTKEQAYLSFYNSCIENQTLLLLTQEVYQEVDTVFQGKSYEKSEPYANILQYSFVHNFEHYSEVDLYLFSHIKSYYVENKQLLDNSPFEPCYLDLDKIFTDLNLNSYSLEYRYAFIKSKLTDFSKFSLAITMLKSDNLDLNFEDVYKIPLIDNLTMPTFHAFSNAMNTNQTKDIIGFSVNVNLREAFMFAVHPINTWNNHTFHNMSEITS
jgi:hypothetical protein